MNDELLFHLLGAVRSAANTLVLSIDAFFRELDKQRREAESTRTTDDEGRCLHPQDECTPAPTFGDPGRRYCKLCRCTVKGVTS